MAYFLVLPDAWSMILAAKVFTLMDPAHYIVADHILLNGPAMASLLVHKPESIISLTSKPILTCLNQNPPASLEAMLIKLPNVSLVPTLCIRFRHNFHVNTPYLTIVKYFLTPIYLPPIEHFISYF